jgi:hypothetical protein
VSRNEYGYSEPTRRPGGVVICVECGCASGYRWLGWQAHRVDDPESCDLPELGFYCPVCAFQEFGRRKPRQFEQNDESWER